MSDLGLVPPPWIDGLPGLQFHHRSVLTWPDLLTAGGRRLLGMLVHTGARVLSFGRQLDTEVAGDARHVPLSVLVRQDACAPASLLPVKAVPPAQEWADVVALHRAGGLTPLAASARADPCWTHARMLDPAGRVLAAASGQRLAAPLADANVLVCCVVSRPDQRHQGLAAACVHAATGGCAAAALVEEAAPSWGFFARLGWVPGDTAHLYRFP